MDDYMTIGRFARASGLSISAVRFYADRGLLEPALTDEASRYRYYRVEQIERGRLIRDLRTLAMPLDAIESALSMSAPERIGLIEQHVATLARQVTDAHLLARSLGASHLTTKDMIMNTATTADPRTTVSMPLSSFREALDRVITAAAIDPRTPHLMTALLESRGGSLRIVATDRHRLAVADLVPQDAQGEAKALLPAAAIRDWLDSVPSDSPEGDGDLVTIEFDAESCTIGRPGRTTTRMDCVPAVFPDYEPRLARATRATSVTLGHADLLAVIDRFVDHREVAIHTTAKGVRCQVAGDEIDVAGVVVGSPRHALLDVGYVRDAVVASRGPEVVLEIESEAEPVVFRSADDGTFTAMVMPILHESTD